MYGPFQRSRRPRKPIINITPLIDVMLILLIFVMASSTFRQYFGIDVALPAAATATPQQRAPHEIVVLDSGAIQWAGLTVTPEQLRAALLQAIEQDPDATFILRGDKNAPFQNVVTAIDIARDAGGQRLIIPTDPLPQVPEPPAVP